MSYRSENLHADVSRGGCEGSIEDQGGCLRVHRWPKQHEHRGVAGECVPQQFVTFPSGFPSDFLGKLAGKIAN